MSLAAKLPYDHPYAGGFRGIGSQSLPTDSDCLAYLAAVAAADGAGVEVGVATAVDTFFAAAKASGVFDAIKASCILCGARTITGALVPLAGAAPTSNGFVSGDYSRTAGLTGDGTSYLDSNRASDADGTNDVHLATYVTSAASGNTYTAGANNGGAKHTLVGVGYWCRTTTGPGGGPPGVGLHAVSRSSSASYLYVDESGSPQTSAILSSAPTVSNSTYVFGYNNFGSASGLTDAAIAFYSIGSDIGSAGLAALDTAVSNLISAMKFHFYTGLSPSGYDADTIRYINAGYAAGGSLE